VRRSISPLTPTIVSRSCGRTRNAKPMITPWSADYSHVRDSYDHGNLRRIPESGSPAGRGRAPSLLAHPMSARKPSSVLPSADQIKNLAQSANCVAR
jgi:hypothetical protein